VGKKLEGSRESPGGIRHVSRVMHGVMVRSTYHNVNFGMCVK
jgi:hypothetical protein